MIETSLAWLRRTPRELGIKEAKQTVDKRKKTSKLIYRRSQKP